MPPESRSPPCPRPGSISHLHSAAAASDTLWVSPRPRACAVTQPRMAICAQRVTELGRTKPGSVACLAHLNAVVAGAGERKASSVRGTWPHALWFLGGPGGGGLLGGVIEHRRIGSCSGLPQAQTPGSPTSCQPAGASSRTLGHLPTQVPLTPLWLSPSQVSPGACGCGWGGVRGRETGGGEQSPHWRDSQTCTGCHRVRGNSWDEALVVWKYFVLLLVPGIN